MWKLQIAALGALLGLSGCGGLGSSNGGARRFTPSILPSPPGVSTYEARGATGSAIVGVGLNLLDKRAIYWNGDQVTDLTPPLLFAASATATFGTAQGGTGSDALTTHALLWTGTAASVVDLHPSSGYSDSYLTSMTSGTQGGYARVGGLLHAVRWSGTSASMVDLHPSTGFDGTLVTGIAPGLQVGYGFPTLMGGNAHALYWNDSSGSMVDIHPGGTFSASRATATDGTSVVGFFDDGSSGTRALLWPSLSLPAVDISPAGYTQSVASGVHGAYQVGSARYSDGRKHAMVWKGTAASYLDLHDRLALLGNSLGVTFLESEALAISENGTVVGSASDTTGKGYAIAWRN